jgi:hypothetical protein
MTDNVAPFPVDPVLTGIALAYRNSLYIADDVLPRVDVESPVFKYQSFAVAETFAAPDSRVGRKSVPNEIDLTETEVTSQTEEFALDEVVPIRDVQIATAGGRRSPVDRATMTLTEYVALSREQRVANLVFAAGSYPSGYKTQLSGTSQWSDYTNSNPVTDLLTGMDAALMRPNVLVLSQEVWTKLRAHPKIVQAVGGQAVSAGIVARAALADILEIEEILVGVARVNTAKKGQTATLARVWGKHAALIYRNRNADTSGDITFGFTAEFGSRFGGQMPEPKTGSRGSMRVRVGEEVKELIVANMAGYFVQDAVA